MYAVPKKVILVSVQKPHFAALTCKEPGSMQRRIGPTVQICGNSGLAIAMVPCLHQWNAYIKRKLRVCIARKCNPCYCAKSSLRSTDLQRTRFHSAPYSADSTTLRNLVLPIDMVLCLHQCNVYIKRKLTVCSAQKCNPSFGAKRPLRSTDLKITRFHAAPYRADSTNLREFGASYRHGTVFVPMECLYQKEAEGIAMPKNIIFVSVQKGHFALRTCKEPGSMQRRIMPSVQICGIRGYLSPWYRVCTNGMFRLKRS